MKYLVTGGAGFIGSHIVEELVKKEEEIIVFDNLHTGTIKNIQPFLDKIEFVQGDVKDLDLLKKAMRGVDYVAHHGSLILVPESVEKPHDYYEVNIKGFHNVLEAARINDVKGITFSSSAAVYGNNKLNVQTETSPLEPESPYAVTKIAGEGLCKFFNRTYGMNTISLRYFNVFGQRQNIQNKYAIVIPIFIQRMLSGQSPIIHGDGEQSRDFIYVKDIVRANLMALQSKNSGGEVFNVSTNKEVSINFLAQELNHILNLNLKLIYENARPGDIFKSCGCADTIKEKIGFTAETTFEQGLKETIEWFKSNTT